MDFDPLLLSRLQFAFTIAFHILFPSFTIGLASWLALLEALWLKTGNEDYRTIYKFWVKIFAISFAMGVVSGVVMSYQFGTNWSRFSEIAGNIMGPLLSYEVLTAFFLEASFLGIMLFGWNKVGPKLHFVATLAVAVGTLISTFWILSANSWMQTPQGHEIIDGIFHPVDWWAIIFNPSFPYRLVHMTLAAYLTTCFVIGGVSAWYLWRGVHVRLARIMFSQATAFAMIVAPAQIVAGDFHGLNTLEHQPVKVAAMEGHWETGTVPLLLFAVPDEEAEENHYEVAIPHLGSLILTHSLDGTVTGLKDFPPQDRPPVGWVFYAFRIMVGIGVLMVFVGLFSLYLRWRGRLYDTRWFQYLCMAMTPAGFVAILAGWTVTEVGRQPYVVYGLLRTADAVSPVPGASVATSLALFMIAYAAVFGAGTYYLLRLIGHGPVAAAPARPADDMTKRASRPMSAAEEPPIETAERQP